MLRQCQIHPKINIYVRPRKISFKDSTNLLQNRVTPKKMFRPIRATFARQLYVYFYIRTNKTSPFALVI